MDKKILNKKIIKTPDEFRGWCGNLKPIWSLDIEASSLKWLDLKIVGFSMCDGQQACYVNITPSVGRKPERKPETTAKYKKELLQILDYYIHEAKMVIMHSAPFDLMVLHKEGIEI